MNFHVDSHSNVLGAFSEDDASRLSGVTKSQLKLWDSNGLLNASYAQKNRRQPYSRVYSFRDLVSLRVLNLLRNEHKVSAQHLKKVAEKLAHLGDAKWTKTTLYVLGKRVVFDDPKTSERREVVSEQRVLDIPLKAAISDTLEAIRQQNVRRGKVVGSTSKQKFVMQNQEVFAGTRIPVSAVMNYLKRGYEDDLILRDFPDLTSDDIELAKRALSESAA
ncbi:MAG: DUF433 domain-containing protein [Pseudomonadota bacterium]